MPNKRARCAVAAMRASDALHYHAGTRKKAVSNVLDTEVACGVNLDRVFCAINHDNFPAAKSRLYSELSSAGRR